MASLYGMYSAALGSWVGGFMNIFLLALSLIAFVGCSGDFESNNSHEFGQHLEEESPIVIGDMLLTKGQYEEIFETEGPSEKEFEDEATLKKLHEGAKYSDAKTWPNGILPIQFAAGITKAEKDKFMNYCKMWGEGTSVKCVHRSGQRAHVYVTKSTSISGACTAQYGYRKNTRRTITLPYSGCWSRRSILHELGHVLGLMHEHQRPDRDRYIRVKWSNIRSDVKFAFDKKRASLKSSKFDFDSIMMYSSYSFTKNYRMPTMVKYNNQQSTWNASSKLSKTDIETMARMYPKASSGGGGGGVTNPGNPRPIVRCHPRYRYYCYRLP